MRLFLLLTLIKAVCQSVTYVDESGNVITVDSIKNVPPKYRYQVVTPTPIPSLSKKDLARLKRQILKEAKSKKLEEKTYSRKLAKEKKSKTKRGKKSKVTPTNTTK